MEVTISGCKLRAVSAAIPDNLVGVHELDQSFSDEDVSRIVRGTGINSVRLIKADQSCLDYCEAAANHLLASENIDRKTVDGIIFVSQTPDISMPASSVMLQDRLGLKKDTVAFDINYGCSGYIYGLYQAALLISSKSCKKVLLFAGDMMSPWLKKNDKHLRLVFGDGMSASLIESGNDSWHIAIESDGSGSGHLNAFGGHLYMDGGKVMEFALREVPAIIKKILSMAHLSKNDIDFFLLHQANQFIVKYLQKKLELDSSRVPVSVDELGNTGPASIPIMMCREKINILGQKSILCGFGIGLSWGAILADLSSVRCYTPIEI